MKDSHFDGAELAEKARLVMGLLLKVTDTPEEAIAILAPLLDSLKKECGIRDLVILKQPPSADA